MLELATILATKSVLTPDVLDVEETRSVPSVKVTTPTHVPTLDELQRGHIREVLSLTSGRVYGRGGAAELLGLKPSTLQSRMAKLGVPKSQHE